MGAPKGRPHEDTLLLVRQLVAEHGLDMFEPRWAEQSVVKYGVTSHTLRIWRRIAASEGLLNDLVEQNRQNLLQQTQR